MVDCRQNTLLSRALSIGAVLILTLGLSLPVFAQGPPDDDLLDFGQGLIPDAADDLRNVPYTSEYRAFLPDRVDLSNWFPTPGAQGMQTRRDHLSITKSCRSAERRRFAIISSFNTTLSRTASRELVPVV